MACDIPKYEIRPLKEAELPQVIGLMCQVHGWESYDETFTATLFDIDPNGCLAAVTSTGKVLSVCLSHRLNKDNGRIARFVTDKEYRRRGIGHQLLTKVMDYLKPRNISLDALQGNEPRYQGYGFNISSFHLTMFKCKANYQSLNNSYSIPGVTILERNQVNFDKLVEYDSKIHTCERRGFLVKWLPPERTNIFVAVNETGNIVGYVGFWRTLTGHRMMPMFADSQEVARMLWIAGISHVPRDSQVEIAVLKENKQAVDLVKEFLVIPDDLISLGTVRMYTEHAVDIPLQKVFAATDYDFSLI